VSDRPVHSKSRLSFRFRIARLLTVLICILFIIFWWRSYRRRDVVGWNSGWILSPDGSKLLCRQTALISGSGEFGLGRESYSQTSAQPPHLSTDLPPGPFHLSDTFSMPEFLHRSIWSTLGFGSRGYTMGLPLQGGATIYEIPYWLPVIVFGGCAFTLVVTGIRRQRRLSRLAAGQCTACGYDLRASPDRCPECGTVAKKNNLQPDPLPKSQ
jgi:hypothetical protein